MVCVHPKGVSQWLQIPNDSTDELFGRHFKGKQIMSMTQTTASGERLTLICETADELVTRNQADTWLRQRQAAHVAPTTGDHRLAS